jgi:hypothetical protein
MYRLIVGILVLVEVVREMKCWESAEEHAGSHFEGTSIL